MEFEIGDRVVVKPGYQIGDIASSGYDYGTVCYVSVYDVTEVDIGVCFDANIGGHDCGGKCEWGHGWYMFPHEISLEGEENESEDHPEPDLSALAAFLN